MGPSPCLCPEVAKSLVGHREPRATRLPLECVPARPLRSVPGWLAWERRSLSTRPELCVGLSAASRHLASGTPGSPWGRGKLPQSCRRGSPSPSPRGEEEGLGAAQTQDLQPQSREGRARSPTAGSATQSTGIESKRRQARSQDPQPQTPLPGDKHTHQSGRRSLTERAEMVQTWQRVSVQHRDSP